MRQVPDERGVVVRTKRNSFIREISLRCAGRIPLQRRLISPLSVDESAKEVFFIRTITSAFSRSFNEFHHARTITTTAMLAAISLILGYLTLDIGPYLKIGFSTIANEFVYLLFGPVVGAFYGGALDILKFLIKPTGPYFPGFTLSAALGGIIYGTILYGHEVSLKRTLAAEFLNCVVCNMFLGTLWLSILYGNAFFALLPARVLKNLLLWPINALLFTTVAKLLERSGFFHLLRRS